MAFEGNRILYKPFLSIGGSFHVQNQLYEYGYGYN